MTPKIAYVAQFFPHLTETFVYREVIALRESGVNVITLANRPQPHPNLPTSAQALTQSTRYILPLTPRRFLLLFFMPVLWLVINPRGWFRMLSTLFTEESRNPRIWLRNVMHVMGACLLAWQIRDEGVLHLHAHFSNNPASLALHLSFLLNLPFSITVHNKLSTDRLLLRAKLKHAQWIVCISQETHFTILSEYSDLFALLQKMSIIHCGIEPHRYRIERKTQQLHHPPIILCASQLVARKGIADLVRACAFLKKRDIPFRCQIAGDGEERGNLETLTRKLDLESYITFLGAYQADDLIPLMREADCFVLPCIVTPSGDVDGIPVVLMEAMASGLPVISTSVGGIPELIQDGQNGLLVEQQNPSAVADAIKRLFGDANLREQLRHSAQATIEHEYNLAVSVQQLRELFLSS